MPFGLTLPTLRSLKSAQPTAASGGPAWLKRLKPASFRGVPFFVESDEQAGGRRAATHEFPGRDTPFAEDLGRKARAFSVQGYVLGADYMQKRDALIAACEADGPGGLVTPWMPERLVLCTEYRKTESGREGGIARISMTFAERGEALLPTAEATPETRANVAADSAAAAAGKKLDATVTVAGVPLPVQSGTLAGIKRLGTAISDVAGVARFAASLPTVLQKLQNLTVADLLRETPSQLCGPLFSLASAYTALTSAYSSSTATPATSLLSRRVDGLLTVASASPSVSRPSGAGTVRALTADNLAALAAYQRRMAVAEAARSAALARPASRQEAAALCASIVDAIDGVLDASNDAGVSLAFTDLRTATLRALSAAAGQAPAVASLETTAVLPVLAIAQRGVVSPGYATDALSAAADILARNAGIRHPGFVPPGGLEVLRAL